MGAFDTYAGVVHCPRCAAPHWIGGQTKFFDPDYETQVCFVVGEVCPVGIVPGDLAHALWEGEWLRVREPARTDRVDLLLDFDELVGCECGFALAIVLRFALGVGTATLAEIAVLDARRPDLASHVDFIDLVTYGSLPQLDHDARERLGAGPVASRADHLARITAAAFDPDDEPEDGSNGWTWVVGPTRCEACGEVRERSDYTLFTHPSTEPFFVGWQGKAIYLGTKIPFDDRWLAEDLDRGHLFRARHPVAPDRLVVLGHQKRFGCPCGAGPVAFVRTFTRRPGELELTELTLRVVATLDDLADVDFIEGPTRTQFGQVVSREHVMSYVLSRYVPRSRRSVD